MKTAVITRRWLVKVCSIMAALTAVVVVSLSLVLHFYYYNTARAVLSSGYNSMVSRYFTMNVGTTDTEFNRAARGYIEAFSSRDTVGVWVIDRHGNVVATSDGFCVPEGTEMADYDDAAASREGKAVWTGKTPTGEKIMAMTYMLGKPESGPVAALRFMVSMENVDVQFRRIVLLLSLVGIAAFALTVIPGALYIEKLMRAVRRTTAAANRIAKGDYDTRIEYSGQDEIGALCTAVHDMAGEISAAEQMKNDFISTVSHELRTPLTAIRGWVETMRQVGAEDAALTQRGMDVIQKETTRLGGMVEELLDFSRIQNGKMPLNRVRMDVLAELEEAIFTFRERAAREKKTLLYASAVAPVQIYGDPNRIMQVFVNIIDNALKYTPPGGTIQIVTGQLNGSIRIAIADTGKGIDPQALPHVKEKFYKADTTVHGSGIGLAVADEIVRLHGGTLNVRSEQGKGTIVTIRLPLWKEEGSEQDGK